MTGHKTVSLTREECLNVRRKVPVKFDSQTNEQLDVVQTLYVRK